MKKYLLAVLLSAALAANMAAAAAAESHDHAPMAQGSHQVKGEVVSVDLAGSRLQLKHAAVPELKWPAMTMYFAVADKAQLNRLKAGDKVEVAFVPQKGAAPLITRIGAVK